MPVFLYGYEAEFIQGLLKAVKKHLAQKFNFTCRYINDVLSLNNSKISEFIYLIYPCELEIKDTAETNTSAIYIYSYLCNNNGKLVTMLFHCTDNGKLVTRLYDKRDDFNFPMYNFPFLSSNISSATAYRVYVSQ